MEGISFMVRVRDEEETIEKSIRSLNVVTVPHEIVVVLHLCTDRTEEIVKSINNPNIRILYYNEEISRAGYACLATDKSSKHSIMTYYDWCKSQTRYDWIFKWDADMIAKPELIDFINSHTWEQRSINYVIGCDNSTSVSREPYLMGGLMYYSKYMFWEVPVYTSDTKTEDLGTWIEHCSELTKLKNYWNIKPWYETEDSEEASIVKSRIQTLTQEIGPEKPGMARCMCSDAEEPYMKIISRDLDNINKFC
jgi:glycosyltransferase involved in cell wall biosynthesis